MRKFLAIFLTLICVVSFANPIFAAPDGDGANRNATPAISRASLKSTRESILLMSMESGEILFSKDANKKVYPASTTKVLTALLALENGDLDEIVTIGKEAFLCPYDSSKAYIDLGEEIPLKSLLFGLMLPSGNDAAYSVAIYVGRKIANNPDLPIKDALKIFIDLMNSRAVELGAVNSHFVTPDGYHDKEHYTTAQDMGLIAREAMTHDTFREIVSTPMFIIEDWSSLHDPESDKTLMRYWRNTNALIQPKDRYYYPDTIGVKTGYTSDARSCLVAAASRDGVELITVIMGSTSELKWLNSAALFDFGFENYTAYAPYPRGKQIEILDVVNNPEQDWVRVMTANAPVPLVHKDDVDRIEQELKWDELIVQGNGDGEEGIVVSAPIARHQKLGTLSFKLDGKTLDTIDLVASTAINVKEVKEPIASITLNDGIEPLQVRLWYSLNQWHWIGIGAVILSFIIVIMGFTLLRRKRRYAFRRRY